MTNGNPPTLQDNIRLISQILVSMVRSFPAPLLWGIGAVIVLIVFFAVQAATATPTPTPTAVGVVEGITATPTLMEDVTLEVTDEATAEVTAEATAEVTAEATLEVTAEASAEPLIAQAATVEPTTVATTEATLEPTTVAATTEATVEATVETISVPATEVLPTGTLPPTATVGIDPAAEAIRRERVLATSQAILTNRLDARATAQAGILATAQADLATAQALPTGTGAPDLQPTIDALNAQIAALQAMPTAAPVTSDLQPTVDALNSQIATLQAATPAAGNTIVTTVVAVGISTEQYGLQQERISALQAEVDLLTSRLQNAHVTATAAAQNNATANQTSELAALQATAEAQADIIATQGAQLQAIQDAIGASGN